MTIRRPEVIYVKSSTIGNNRELDNRACKTSTFIVRTFRVRHGYFPFVMHSKVNHKNPRNRGLFNVLNVQNGQMFQSLG